MEHPDSSVIRSAAVGAGAGIGATVVMSALMLAGRRAGLTGELPPERIAREAVQATTGRAARPGEEHAIATIGHFGFGAVAGALYGILTRESRGGAAAGARSGIVFATAIWLISYQGWVPGLHILPPASRDRPGRVATMIAAHWVYGAILGIATNRLRDAFPTPRG